LQGTRWFKRGSGDIDQNLVDAIKQAIATGYRHFDAAEGVLPIKLRLNLVYGTEEELGVALKEVNVPREECFITTKILSNIADPEKALKTSLRKLQIDYVDLYLIHAPFKADIEKTWKSLEILRDQG
jgi:diketogulonate reductase-like aldo/keto reductase